MYLQFEIISVLGFRHVLLLHLEVNSLYVFYKLQKGPYFNFLVLATILRTVCVDFPVFSLVSKSGFVLVFRIFKSTFLVRYLVLKVVDISISEAFLDENL